MVQRAVIILGFFIMLSALAAPAGAAEAPPEFWQYLREYPEDVTHIRDITRRTADVAALIVTPEMPEYDRVVAIANWIGEHIEYDYSLRHRGVYDALTRGKSVCHGISLLASLLLSEAGVENRVVHSERSEEFYHSWNMVRVDGAWYHVDFTEMVCTGSFALRTDAEVVDFWVKTGKPREKVCWPREQYPAAQIPWAALQSLLCGGDLYAVRTGVRAGSGS